MIQLSHLNMTTRKTIALTIWTFVGNPNMSHIIYHTTIVLFYLHVLINCKFLIAETVSIFLHCDTTFFFSSAWQLKIFDKKNEIKCPVFKPYYFSFSLYHVASNRKFTFSKYEYSKYKKYCLFLTETRISYHNKIYEWL